MNRIPGIALVAISAGGFGTLAIFRYACADGMDVFTVLFLRFSLSAVVMTMLLVVRRGATSPAIELLRRLIRKPCWKDECRAHGRRPMIPRSAHRRYKPARMAYTVPVIAACRAIATSA